MWSVPAKNMKKINMSISYVYDVSIQGNCENAVFTFLPFYKQNIAFFLFLTYHCRVVDFGYSEGESLSYCTCRITFFYYKGVFNGNYTANPKQGRTHGFQDVL